MASSPGSNLHQAEEGPVWNTRCCIVVLEEALRELGGMGFRTEPIRLVRGQQDGEWKTMHHSVHVDDLKVSHIDPKVVGDVLDQINQEHGKEALITIT